MTVRLVATAVLALLACSASAEDSRWIADAATGCRLRNDVPQAGAQVSWNGACVDGLADGPGVATTTTGNRFEGTFHGGRRVGHGVLTWLNGNRFEGEWRANKLNGSGTYDQAGHLFSGDWKDGCFDHDGLRAVVASTAQDCGFD